MRELIPIALILVGSLNGCTRTAAPPDMMIGAVDASRPPVFTPAAGGAESVDGYVCRVAYIPTLPATADWSGNFGRLVGQLTTQPHCSGQFPFFFFIFSEGATQENIVANHYLYSEAALLEAYRTLQDAGQNGLKVTFSLLSDRSRLGWFYIWYYPGS